MFGNVLDFIFNSIRKLLCRLHCLRVSTCTMPRTSKKDRSGHMQEETTAKHKLNLDNDEPGTDNSPTSSPLRGYSNMFIYLVRFQKLKVINVFQIMETGKFRLIGCGGYVCFICRFRGNTVSSKTRKKERK